MKFLVEPWKHQLQAFERSKTLPEYAYLFDPGCGKSGVTINRIRWEFAKRNRIMRTLILCPSVVIENWKDEFTKHSKIGSRVYPLYGPIKKRIAFAEGKVQEDDGQVFVTNYEGLVSSKDFAQFFREWKPEIVVFDELHYLKAHNTLRTKLCAEIARNAEIRLGLSGTPVLNSLLDVFSQWLVLDNGATFGKNFFAFRAEYFYDKNASMPKDRYFPDWRIRPESAEKISALMAKKASYAKKVECLDLPPLVIKNVFVDLSKEQAQLYEALKKDFVAYCEDKACVATLAITKALRMMQVVTGYIPLEEISGKHAKSIKKLDNPRAKALKSLLEQIAPIAKVCVWACYKDNYETIRGVCDELGLGYVEVTGETAGKDRFENVRRFNEDADCRVYLGHPGSGGIGINLTAASYSIFYSRTFSYGHDVQAEARNHRGGSEIHERITRINLVARGTIDEHIHARLQQKQEISGKVLAEIAQIL